MTQSRWFQTVAENAMIVPDADPSVRVVRGFAGYVIVAPGKNGTMAECPWCTASFANPDHAGRVAALLWPRTRVRGSPGP